MTVIDPIDFRTFSLRHRHHLEPETLTAADLSAWLIYTDRTSYLSWVSAWKAYYAELSITIRADKQSRRAAARAQEPAAAWWQGKLSDQRRQARVLICLRRVAKADSWVCRNASRQPTLV